MTDGPGLPPFMTAWLQGQQAFAQLAGSGFAAQSMRRRHRALLRRPVPATVRACRALHFGGTPRRGAGLLLARYQQAAERFARLLNAIAIDAARRLAHGAGRHRDREAPPITSLRELHALWIDCGEAAWSAAAHREEFAAAQAELFAALVALRATVPAP